MGVDGGCRALCLSRRESSAAASWYRLTEYLNNVKKKHLTAFVECYGLESLIPKNHYSMHIPEQWLECLMRWFDCWPQERKHRLIIAKAVKVYNTEVYEKSVISRLWHDTYMKWTGDNIDKHFHSAAWSAAELPGRVIRCRRM